MPPMMTIKYSKPAILALRRGDVSTIRSVISWPQGPPHERGDAEYPDAHQGRERN